MAMRFLKMLIRHDHPLPTNGVKLIVSGLTNDAVAVRKVPALYCNISMFLKYTIIQMAISGLVLVLQQQKRKHRKVPVDMKKEGELCNNMHVMTWSVYR